MMTAEQLRGSILQLAMQGKLVEQRPEEGTGQDLYKIILAEKKKLIKEGKIKKQKPLPEISEDEIPFEIPDTWLWVRVVDVCTKLVDGDHNPPKGISGTSEFIMASSRNINQDRLIDLNQVRYLDKDTFLKENERTMASKGDIFFTSVGSLGRSCVYDGSLNICFQRSVSVMTTLVFNHYLKRCFDSGYFQNKVNREATGTAQKGFYLNQLATALIPLPPLAEQKRIVAKIEELIPFVEQYAAVSTKLNTLNTTFPDMMKKSILQEAVQGKLVPQDPNDEPASVLLKKIRSVLPNQKLCKDDLNFDSMEFELPDKWEWAELNQLFDFVDYRGKTPHKIDKGVFLITASNIKQGFMEYTRKEYISEEEYKDRQSRGITNRGDLLFTTEAPMGNAAICDLEKCSCGQRIITFKPFYEGTVIPELFMFFILSPCFQQQLLNNCTGTTAKGIKADKLKHFKIPLPPIKEQSRILKRIKEAMPLID